MSKGQKVRKRLVPNPFVPGTIPEEEIDQDETESEEEEEVPLHRRTRQAKAIEIEVRKNATSITPSTQSRPVELSSSEDEVQRWVDKQSEQGEDVFSIADFMPVGTELVGDKIRDTPIVEPQQEEWTQRPPDAQDFGIAPPSPPQITLIDKGSVTPPPLSSEEEHVQKGLPQ